MTGDPSEPLRAAIAACRPVRAARDVLALMVASGEGDDDRMAELTAEAAVFLKRENPHLRESVDQIAQFIAATAAIAGAAIASDARLH